MTAQDYGIDDSDLKSCPFCGHKAELRSVGISAWTVRCTNKACYAELAAYRDPLTAILKWNMRIYSEVNL